MMLAGVDGDFERRRDALRLLRHCEQTEAVQTKPQPETPSLDRFAWLAMTESLETEPMGRIPTAGPYDGAVIGFTPMACSSAAPTLALPSPSCAIPRNSRWTNPLTELRHGLKKAAFTLSPRARPIRAAVPPLSSSTAMHGPSEGTTASDNGSALAAICVTLPSGAMKTISSGM
jgi:hypothetical protein